MRRTMLAMLLIAAVPVASRPALADCSVYNGPERRALLSCIEGWLNHDAEGRVRSPILAQAFAALDADDRARGLKLLEQASHTASREPAARFAASGADLLRRRLMECDAVAAAD